MVDGRKKYWLKPAKTSSNKVNKRFSIDVTASLYPFADVARKFAKFSKGSQNNELFINCINIETPLCLFD